MGRVQTEKELIEFEDRGKSEIIVGKGVTVWLSFELALGHLHSAHPGIGSSPSVIDDRMRNLIKSVTRLYRLWLVMRAEFQSIRPGRLGWGHHCEPSAFPFASFIAFLRALSFTFQDKK